MTLEQLKALINDKNVPLTERFIKASVIVGLLRKTFEQSIAEELVFYAHYKQAIFGECKDDSMSILESLAQPKKAAKLSNWQKPEIRKLTQLEAQNAYIQLALKAVQSIKAGKMKRVNEICDGITEESIIKMALEKLNYKKQIILVIKKDSDNDKGPEPGIIQQAEESKVESYKGQAKLWKEVAELIKGKLEKLKTDEKERKEGQSIQAIENEPALRAIDIAVDSAKGSSRLGIGIGSSASEGDLKVRKDDVKDGSPGTASVSAPAPMLKPLPGSAFAAKFAAMKSKMGGASGMPVLSSAPSSEDSRDLKNGIRRA